MAEEKKYAQISNESIQTWAESAGVTDLSPEILNIIASDATYRLHQTLTICRKHLSHCNRKKLTSDDFNRSLKLMDVSPVYGYSGSETVDWVNVPELGIYVPHDPPVNLASTALSGDIFHQPGNTFVKGKWSHVSGHVIIKSESNSGERSLSSLPLSPHLVQYYRALFSVTTNPSAKLFETMCEDVGSSPKIGPLVGPIIRSVLKGAQKSSQKAVILRRLLLIIRALLFNPHIHLGPHNYIHDIVNVLVFSAVTERKNPQDTQSIRTLASNILLKLSRKEGDGSAAWELAVNSLSGVIGSSTRPWTQHAGALTGLIPLGFSALYKALMPVVSEYYTRLGQTLSNTPSAALSSAILAKDILDANMTYGLLLISFVNMMVSLQKSLPDKHQIYVGKGSPESTQSKHSKQEAKESSKVSDLIQEIQEVYYLGEEIFGSAFVLQVPPSYLHCGKAHASPYAGSPLFQEDLSEEGMLKACRPPPYKRRKYSLEDNIFKRSQTASSHVIERINIHPVHTFENYRPIIPVKKRKIFMCIRGCSTRKFEFLRQRKGVLPDINQHPDRALLIRHAKAKMVGRMPHWTFIRPLCSPPRPCSSLNFIIL